MKPLSDKIDEKLKKREERYDRERRFRVKSSEDLETLEEVFDKRTLLTILKILNIGKLKEITGVLKAGKRAGSITDSTQRARRWRSRSSLHRLTFSDRAD